MHLNRIRNNTLIEKSIRKDGIIVMAPVFTKEKIRHKYVSIRSNVILTELGNIQGPVINPTWMDIETIRTLVYNNRKVYEHSALEPAKRILLTRKNYNDFNIYPENAEIEDPTLKPNTYLVRLTDMVPEKDMAPGNLYVEILNP